MNEFSYEEDFDFLARIIQRTAHDDFAIEVGERESTEHNTEPEAFTAVGEFYSVDGFSTYNDARRARELVLQTLRFVDKNLSVGLKLSDVRDSILANLNRATSGNLMSKGDAMRAVREVTDYYIEQGA